MYLRRPAPKKALKLQEGFVECLSKARPKSPQLTPAKCSKIEAMSTSKESRNTKAQAQHLEPSCPTLLEARPGHRLSLTLGPLHKPSNPHWRSVAFAYCNVSQIGLARVAEEASGNKCSQFRMLELLVSSFAPKASLVLDKKCKLRLST